MNDIPPPPPTFVGWDCRLTGMDTDVLVHPSRKTRRQFFGSFFLLFKEKLFRDAFRVSRTSDRVPNGSWVIANSVVVSTLEKKEERHRSVLVLLLLCVFDLRVQSCLRRNGFRHSR